METNKKITVNDITPDMVLDFHNNDQTEELDETTYSQLQELLEYVKDENNGDGHEYYVTYRIKGTSKYVTLEGYYSSWDSSQLDEAYWSNPYMYCEVLYRKVGTKDTKEYKRIGGNEVDGVTVVTYPEVDSFADDSTSFNEDDESFD